MNRVTRGTVVLAVALTALSCKGDPTDSLRNGVDHLIATPSAVFLVPNETFTILVEAVDEQGNRQGTTFNLGTVGAGITVVEDDSFNLVFDKNGNQVKPKSWPRVQYEITATDNIANTSFTVSAGGKSLTIPVRAIPDSTTSLTLSTAVAAVGDTVTATAPAGFKFTPASVVTISGAAVATLGISADSNQITFVPGPGAATQVVVSNLVVSYATSLGGYSANSGTVVLSTPAAASLGINVTNANVGDTIIVTAPAPYKFRPTSAVTVGTAGLAVIARAADSSSITFLIGPNASVPVSVNNVVINNTPGAGTFTLTTGAAVLTTPVLSSIAATFSSATPAIGTTLTVTLPAGYKFISGRDVLFGGAEGFGVVFAADSSSVSMVPPPGFTGAPTITNAAFSVLLQVPITLPTTGSITVGAGLPGTDDPNTAPAIPIPGVGSSVTFWDNGDPFAAQVFSEDRIYAINMPAAGNITFALDWSNDADVDILFVDGAFANVIPCYGGATGSQPENVTCALPAGTSFLIANLFAGTAPSVLRWTVTR